VWQCGTIQLDMNLPERFDLTYVDQNGEKVRPVMVHRVIFGSIERFIGILIEHFAGAFPLWLAPAQVKVIPVKNEYHLDYSQEIFKLLEAKGIRVEIDDREEKLGYRIREAQMKKIPYQLVLGDKERDERTVTYRQYGEQKQTTVSLDEFICMILKQIEDKAL
ncbi:MAG: His/Gly/Thr/Pro-type tRNA ligase C-terminal domain-containing protein, partial [Coprobacillus cateniformis]